MEVFDSKFSLKKPYGRIEEHIKGWDHGEVVTPCGIVSVYAQGDDENFYMTRLDFAHNNVQYSRSFHGKRYSHRGIVTKANQFAKHIVGI